MKQNITEIFHSQGKSNIPQQPTGHDAKKIPKAYYAVFTVNGNNANGEIGKAFQYIYGEWLPQSEYYLSDELCADFEFYDERWDCQSPSAQMDLYIPVKKFNTTNHESLVM